ncbi:AzlD domain-containing protein [Klebsiella pneumoniae]|uniref:AzlD domain-containing protein n=1 Tax=Klebsiella pneumoniae TaxID=573 RepID=UPI00045275E9|nr:AzlD domain-containing protein [Klebsiella pneumoniae]EKI2324359.1 AzlD domain-containing protein [Klebsiella pneumoniae]EKZ6824572.1 AzlD domain-containing protein [Klebsiella pneumoniae]EKZ6884448.1 AzlD domain-containing protein [Klebsiella pneumoniae]EWE04608.1 transmembrane protein [Klebsiella pneumoniae BIDMC 48]MBD7141789.1 AzlD domain-containing protein [Klebsiella pneumoniae]
MSNSYFIALTLGMAAVTFLIRFSFIGLAGKIQMSERVTKTLRFVPVTVLPAIITIQILSVNSSMEFDLKNPKVIICTLASFRLGLVWVVVSGVGSLVLLNYFM